MLVHKRVIPSNNTQHQSQKTFAKTALALMLGTSAFAVNASSSFNTGAITSTELTSTATLPAEPPAYSTSTQSPSQVEFARFAWRNFIYLNSPAKPSGTVKKGKSTVLRDTIDPARTFVDSGKTDFYQSGQTKKSNFSKNILVWESYAHRTELLPYTDSSLPELTNAAPTYRYYQDKVEITAKQARFNHLDENSQIGQNQIFFPKNGSTPSTTSFYDDYQILFEAKVNKPEYDYISTFLNENIAAKNNAKQGTTPTITVPTEPLPPNSTITDDAIEIKAAWRVLTQEQFNSGRYHTAEAVYYVDKSGEPEAKIGTFGLIGLHIIRKTKNYPTFIFSTFQHVDNLVTPSGDPTGLYYVTKYDTLAYDAQTPANPMAVINQDSISYNTVKLPLAGAISDANGYDIIPGTFNLPSGMGGPIFVKQPPTITGSTDAVNAEVKAAMAKSGMFKDSVWQYYELKGVQAIPINEPAGTGTPTAESENFYLANNVIESSQPGVQLFKGGVAGPSPASSSSGGQVFTNNRAANNIFYPSSSSGGSSSSSSGGSAPAPVNMGGCMGCHGNAKFPGQDFSSFNFLTVNKKRLAGHGYLEPDTVGAPSGGKSGDQTLEEGNVYLDTGE